MSDNKLYPRVCKYCGVEFKSPSAGKLLCPECVTKSRNKAREKYRKKKKAKPCQVIPIGSMVHIIEQYNSSHGTSYTYGKFVQLINSGHIDIREVLN